MGHFLGRAQAWAEAGLVVGSPGWSPGLLAVTIKSCSPALHRFLSARQSNMARLLPSLRSAEVASMEASEREVGVLCSGHMIDFYPTDDVWGKVTDGSRGNGCVWETTALHPDSQLNDVQAGPLARLLAGAQLELSTRVAWFLFMGLPCGVGVTRQELQLSSGPARELHSVASATFSWSKQGQLQFKGRGIDSTFPQEEWQRIFSHL